MTRHTQRCYMQPECLPKGHLFIFYHINIQIKKHPANEWVSQSGPLASTTNILSFKASSPVSDRAEKAAKIPCSRRNKLCSATQPVRHLSDCSYRLVAFCPVFPRPATFLALEHCCLELAQERCKQPDEQPRREMTAIFGNAPFLEATDISKKIQRQSQFLEATLSYRSAFLKTKCSSLSHSITSGSAYWVSVVEQPPA